MNQYREIAPLQPLAQKVEAIWCFENPTPDGGNKRILPDGCIDVIFDLTGKRNPVWVGTMTKPLIVPQTSATVLLGVRFRPGFAGLLLGGAIVDMVDRQVDASELGQKAVVALGERLVEIPKTEDRVKAVNQWLCEGFTVPGSTSASAMRALAVVAACSGGGLISGWAGTSDLGMRQLERLLKQQVGITPSEFRSLMRFRKAREIIDKTGSVGVETALEAGYFDQPHLIREFKRFSGLTPKEYLMSH